MAKGKQRKSPSLGESNQTSDAKSTTTAPKTSMPKSSSPTSTAPIVESASALFARRLNGRAFLHAFLGVSSGEKSPDLVESSNRPLMDLPEAASPKFLVDHRVQSVREYLNKAPKWEKTKSIQELFERWRAESQPGPRGRCRKSLETARQLRRVGNDIYRLAAQSMQQHQQQQQTASNVNSAAMVWNQQQLARAQHLDSQSALQAFEQLTRACAEYVGAMMYAPQDSEEYALAVANRSAIHFETLNYVACLQDIEEALRSGYPLASKHKLLRRRALCYAHALASLLADDGKAERNAGDLYQWAPRRARMLPGNSPRRVCEELQATLKEIQGLSSADKPFVDACRQEFNDWMRVFADRNAMKAMEAMKKMHRMQGISNDDDDEDDDGESRSIQIADYTTDMVRFDTVQGRGRAVLARQPLKKETPIMVEHALCVAPFRSDAMRCEHCLQSEPLTALPCPYCVGVMFCSRRCMELSDHCNSMCCREQAMVEDMWENAVLALHIYDICLRKPDCALNQHMESLFYTESFTSAYVFYMAVTASILGQYLQLSVGEQMQLFRCLGRVCCNSVVIKSSGFAATVRSHGCEHRHVDVIEDDLLGIGLFGNFARLNHSCSPNSGYTFKLEKNQTPVVIVSTEHNVAANQELTISYGPLAKTMTRSKRQRVLKERYSFDCHCTACESNVDMAAAYQCWHCASHIDEGTANCPDCDAKIDWALYRKIEQCADRLVKEGQEQMCMQLLKDAMRLRKKIFHRRSRQIAAIHDSMAFLASMREDYQRALKHCERSLTILNDYYSPEDPEFVREQCKLINIYQHLGRFDLLVAYIDRLKPLVKRLFGESDSDYVDMVQTENMIRGLLSSAS